MGREGGTYFVCLLFDGIPQETFLLGRRSGGHTDHRAGRLIKVVVSLDDLTTVIGEIVLASVLASVSRIRSGRKERRNETKEY